MPCWRGVRCAVAVPAGEEDMRMYAETVHGNATALDALINQHGFPVRHFPDPVFQAMLEPASEVVDEAGAAGDIWRRTYASWKAFRDQMAVLQPHGTLRYLGHITGNRRGRPLASHEVAGSLNGATTGAGRPSAPIWTSVAIRPAGR